MTYQTIQDKKYQYFGSSRMFYSGLTIGSSSTWAFVNFSGTNTGFGPDHNVLSQRFMIMSSGTSVMQWSWNSGTDVHGDLFGGETVTQDGVTRSGVWVRASAASQKVKLWSW